MFFPHAPHVWVSALLCADSGPGEQVPVLMGLALGWGKVRRRERSALVGLGSGRPLGTALGLAPEC